MAGRNPQSMGKRAREQAVRERRERKRAKKAEAAVARAAAKVAAAGSPGDSEPPVASVVAEQPPNEPL